ncbi:MAG: hypothetical protein A2784_00045 [Candidatus Chisholmbacteria bacterium RIFCSPHIGHO2_01_FULL_48_12]|uniref:Polymerase nucleotidyl transferase domain-containing protein n=1 Tax=Candidatus Chisholmbacteria bacterium RIFCSPHIGHO2_01_FULL_48_12 TaxID=1797589 RepID=A0A1G1VL00_9BACT|nr:MAG: hypothetical protein A2784_00045 [Candidatus Chisholmbacteria bacterium RIFCSPHIGHO2_01_FULL_48_12]
MTKQLKQEIDLVVSQLVANYKPEKVILFGSAARGDATEESDLDFLVIKAGVEQLQSHERYYQVSKIISHRVATDVLVYTPQEIKKRLYLEDPFIRQIWEEGMVVYGA